MSALTWYGALTDDQAEMLRDDVEAVAVGGDSDWRIAVYAYDIPVDVESHGVVIPAGQYVRTVEGNNVQAYRVEGDTVAYVDQVEAEYDAYMDASESDGDDY